MPTNEVDRYIAQYEGPQADMLRALRALVKEALPNANEKISWGMPSYALDNGYVFHYAAHKNHVGIYPGPQAITTFHDEIAPRYKMSKGAFQLPLGGEIPRELILRILQYSTRDDQW